MALLGVPAVLNHHSAGRWEMSHVLLYFILEDLFPFQPPDYAEEFSDGRNPPHGPAVPKEGMPILIGPTDELGDSYHLFPTSVLPRNAGAILERTFFF